MLPRTANCRYLRIDMLTLADSFEPHRAYLFALAYRMLGSASEAEDVVQDAFLRATAAANDEIRSAKAYLTTIVTRLCLDRLRAARATREQYLGPWLPEPVLTSSVETDPEQIAEQHEAITLAFLVLLESLTAAERAVFLLREVFEYDYPTIAGVVQLSESNCRQLVHRARSHLAEKRPRFRAAPEHHHELVTRFLAAAQQGDMAILTAVLAEDVQFWADSGGKVPAPRKPLRGRDLIAPLCMKFVANVVKLVDGAVGDVRAATATVNGEPAALVWVRDQLDTVVVLTFEDAQITALRLIRNPEKLHYIQRQLEHR
jgi:RNA polymerase sigma-70 factor (TIGR02957 family)